MINCLNDDSKFGVGQKVEINGINAIYTVEGYFEQFFFEYGSGSYKLMYILRDVETKAYRECPYYLLAPILSDEYEKMDIQTSYQEYEDYLLLEEMFKDGAYAKKARDLLGFLKRKSR